MTTIPNNMPAAPPPARPPRKGRDRSSNIIPRIISLPKTSTTGGGSPSSLSSTIGSPTTTSFGPLSLLPVGPQLEQATHKNRQRLYLSEQVGKSTEQSGKSSSSPAGLFFQHAGHRDKVVDFHWNACDPWTLVSVSDDCDSNGGGGTLQIWRTSDLIYRPEVEVLAELEEFKSRVSMCSKVINFNQSVPFLLPMISSSCACRCSVGGIEIWLFLHELTPPLFVI